MDPETLNRLKIDARPSPRHSHTSAWWALAAMVLLSVILTVWFVEHKGIRIETATVSEVYPTQTFTVLNASGYVVAQRKAAVSSKTTGRLEWIGVQEGSRVNSGQVIARLENRDTDAAVSQALAGVKNARAALDQARADMDDAGQSYSRHQQLFTLGIISRAEYDSTEARFKKTSAAVAAAVAGVGMSESSFKGAQVAYSYSLLRAPFAAVVLTKNADVGDIITPLGAAANAKAAVVTIADLSSLQVEADVSESNLDKVKSGQPCEILLDALPHSRFRAVLQTIVPTADRSKASVQIKVRFLDSDTRILPEMSAKVAILSRPPTAQDQRKRIALNPAAVARVNGRDCVYLLDNGRVRLVPVSVGHRIGDLVEVSGVKPGDKVAVRPLNRMKDGRKVYLEAT